MKKLTSLLLLIISFAPLCAQHNFDQKLVEAFQKEAGDHAALYYAPLEQPFNVTRWANDPFWDGQDGSRGSICYDGIVYDNVLMRFNVAEQQLSVATPSNNILVTPYMSKVSYFVLYGKRFEKIDGLYACQEYVDNGVEFWNAKKKIKGQDVLKGFRSFYSYNEINLYYLKKDGVLYPVKKAKDIIRLFPTQEKRLKKILRQSHTPIQSDRHAEMLFILNNLSN